MPVTDIFSRTFSPLRLRYLDSPLPEWIREVSQALLSLLPMHWRRQMSAHRRRLLLDTDGQELQLHALIDNQRSLIGAIPLGDDELLTSVHVRLNENSAGVPRWLMLDDTSVLRRVMTLPASAEPRLRDVLTHEIDRQTPFSADQVSFESRVLTRDVQRRQLQVELIVLPKTQLMPVLSELGPLAQGLAGVDIWDRASDCGLGVNLLPVTQRAGLADRAGLLNVCLLFIATLVLFAAMFIIRQNRTEALERFTLLAKTSRMQAQEAGKLRSELTASVTAANFLAKRRAEQPTMLELLGDLTRRIPDNTSLERLSINEGQIELVGQSEQAPALVALLQSSKLLKTPALAGAVQADPRTGHDRFTLTATVVGSDQEAANGRSH